MAVSKFIPRSLFVEEAALGYPMTDRVVALLKDHGVVPRILRRGKRVDFPGKNTGFRYAEAKQTLVLRVLNRREFERCRPSADFQLPLISSCPGLCEYCYLQTRLGSVPYIRAYVNVESILESADRAALSRLPDTTTFEGSATSDPVAVEWLTGSLRQAIRHFAVTPSSYFRFVTKFADAQSLSGIEHKGRTTVRVSLNVDEVVKKWEHRTSPLTDRLNFLRSVREEGYPVGVMIGPVFLIDGWERQYSELLEDIRNSLGECDGLDVEVITHRYTPRAKENILAVFPNTSLPMEDRDRRFVRGQFGYGKFVYSKDKMEAVKRFFEEQVPVRLPGAAVKYIV